MNDARPLSNPAAVMARLAEIETDLAKRQNEYETAASEKAKLVRDWEKRYASHRVTAKGNDAEARKAAALGAAIDQDDLFERLRNAESAYEACKTVVKVLEIRTGIGQSILKAQGRG